LSGKRIPRALPLFPDWTGGPLEQLRNPGTNCSKFELRRNIPLSVTYPSQQISVTSRLRSDSLLHDSIQTPKIRKRSFVLKKGGAVSCPALTFYLQKA
jgi:hypothetical protein